MNPELGSDASAASPRLSPDILALNLKSARRVSAEGQDGEERLTVYTVDKYEDSSGASAEDRTCRISSHLTERGRRGSAEEANGVRETGERSRRETSK
eukprot:746463-Hanusia_phi.AAC.10